MNRKPLLDFRSTRELLAPEVFVFGVDYVAPTDLVDPEMWRGIMHLPDNVAINTSAHSGTRMQLFHSLWGDWVSSIGDPDAPDEISNCALDAADCLQASHFNFLHGYYRTALAELRTALELVMVGTFGQHCSADMEYQAWNSGQSERMGFTRARRALRRQLSEAQAKLLTDDSPMARWFADLCRFTHSRPDSSDGAIWRSNGPIHSHEAVLLVQNATLSVYALYHLLLRIARPDAPLPKDGEILFELDWMPDHKALADAHLALFGASTGARKMPMNGPEFFYRFRSTEWLLRRQKLENQQIYFSAPDKLNDPVEGFKDVVWNGDDVVWRNLLRHYAMCLVHAGIMAFTSGPENATDYICRWVKLTPNDIDDPGIRRMCSEAASRFVAEEVCCTFVSLMSRKQRVLRRNELAAHFPALHPSPRKSC